MTYAKIEENGYLFIEDIKEGESPTEGCKPLDDIDNSKLVQVDELTHIEAIPYDIGDRISFRYIPRIDEYAYNNKLFELKHQLQAEDYKIIKCYEANLVEEEIPYNIKELRKKREMIRDEIRTLERLKENTNQND